MIQTYWRYKWVFLLLHTAHRIPQHATIYKTRVTPLCVHLLTSCHTQLQYFSSPLVVDKLPYHYRTWWAKGVRGVELVYVTGSCRQGWTFHSLGTANHEGGSQTSSLKPQPQMNSYCLIKLRITLNNAYPITYCTQMAPAYNQIKMLLNSAG